MKGLNKDTALAFQSIKYLDILDEYLLIGGTALSLQIGHRLSEDLDFCKWQDNPKLKNKEVDWPAIERALKKVGGVSTEVLDLFQVNFLLNNVKLTFYSSNLADSRDVESNLSIDKVRLATIKSLGAMKLEVMSRRNVFRDYYDVYAIILAGYSLKELVGLCGRYSRHRMKSKMVLAMLSNGSLFKYEEDFELLEPKYKVTSEEIESFMRTQIRKEF